MIFIKKICFLVSILVIAIFITSCESEPKELKDISCEEIALAYETAGYFVYHGEHNYENDCYCHIIVQKEKDSINNGFIYFDFYNSPDAAKSAAKGTEYNIVLWLFSAIHGELRWLNSKSYGNIHYHYYDVNMTVPFYGLAE